MRTATYNRSRAILAAPFLFAACDLAKIEVVVPVPYQVVAEVTAVVTVEPTDPSRSTTHVTAIMTRYPDGGHPHGVRGASVVVSGESGQSVQLLEEADPVERCVNRDFFGSCYMAVATPGIFGPGERLSLTATLADGSQLTGSSRIPGTFLATDLALEDGQCRLAPGTNHRFAWNPVDEAVAYVAESDVHGLGQLGLEDGTLHLETTFIEGDRTEITFPREFLYELDLEAARVLRVGLPDGASADIALGAVDLNWTNWIREGRINLSGDVRVPSVFGDGTGWFGTAVRWRLSVESREANGDDDLPLCGPALDD